MMRALPLCCLCLCGGNPIPMSERIYTTEAQRTQRKEAFARGARHLFLDVFRVFAVSESGLAPI